MFELIKPIYIMCVSLLYLGYFLIIFGIYKVNAIYILYLSTLIHVFVCGFLLIRFNPFYKNELVQFDRDIVFGSSLLLLFNIFVTFGFINTKKV
jgi:hypothetical protein